jgi:hypothetical protein
VPGSLEVLPARSSAVLAPPRPVDSPRIAATAATSVVWPQRCACCLGEPDTNLIDRFRLVHATLLAPNTHESKWAIPYCTPCLEHADCYSAIQDCEDRIGELEKALLIWKITIWCVAAAMLLFGVIGCLYGGVACLAVPLPVFIVVALTMFRKRRGQVARTDEKSPIPNGIPGKVKEC